MKYNGENLKEIIWSNIEYNKRRGTNYNILRNATNSYDVYLGTIDYNNIIKPHRVETLDDNVKLLFDKGSDFPRVKLQNTSFKRCIKESKADVIVVPKIETGHYWVRDKFSLLKLDDQFAYDDWNLRADYKQVLSDSFNNIELLYQGKATLYTSKYDWVIKYVNGEYTKPFIYDTDLDVIVNKAGEELTEDVINSVIDMLKSPDKETNKLGLVTLSGFNIEPYKNTIRFILETYSNWKTIQGKGVLIENLADSLNVNMSNRMDQRYVINSVFRNPISSDKDGEMMNKLAIPVLRDCVTRFVEQYFYGDHMPKINITIDEYNSD